MDCTEAKLWMEPYAAGSIALKERALVDEHLARCEGCRLEMELVRAMGSEAAPASQPGEKPSDWTLDRIFGDGDGAPGVPPAESGMLVESLAPPSPESPSLTQPPESPPAPQPPYESVVSPGGAETETASINSLLDAIEPPRNAAPAPSGTAAAGPPPAAPPGRAAASPGGGGAAVPNWDFEPVDSSTKAAPPPKSLFFAEEALERQREGEGRKKGSALRRLLWIAGGLAGVAFLGLSVWIALAVRQPSVAPPATVDRPANPSAAQPEPIVDSEGGPVAASLAPTGDPLADAGAPQAAPEPAAVRPPEPARTESVAGGSEAKRAAKPSASREPAAARPPDSRETAAGAKPLRPPAPPEPVRAILSPGPSSPAHPGARGAAIEAEPVEDETSFAGGEPEARPSPAPEQEPAAPPSAAQTPKPASAAVGPTAAPAEPARSDPTAPAAGAPAEAPAPTVERPIDRIHHATVAAEERGDLGTLRKLKDTWKNLIAKSGVGPDRSRAKREYADCLWAIQTLTGRLADQKTALTAYRDYLLNAPAGGADTRSVGRTRLLEDALSESR